MPPTTPGKIAEPADSEGERRQLTVLFCDMAGSTEMAGRLDVEDYHEVVGLYQHATSGAVVALDGYVAQYLGDGIVAYFGWPVAHGDDAERAVRAGLEILDSLERVNRNLRDDRKIAARISGASCIRGNSNRSGYAELAPVLKFQNGI